MMGSTATATSIEQFCATPAGARRFLQRATFGPRRGDVEHLMEVGPTRWFDEQVAMGRGRSHLDILLSGSDQRLQFVVWEHAFTGEDLLRRRVAYALSQIFVVSDRAVGSPEVAAYADLLEDHAFGDFRQMLEAITLSPAMSRYLSLQRSARANPTTGSSPDENFAREVMQLFTIGLWELNRDGSRSLRNGQPIPTYDLDDVLGVARALTGWNVAQVDGPARHNAPMVPNEPTSRWHESGEKRFLGITIGANTGVRDSLRLTLDRLASHPNVGPFIGRQLIQRLVTSNPSPGYVERVATVFENDGTGRRGNLGAVVRSVLTDRDSIAVDDPETFGKLREPALRFTVACRALGLRSSTSPFRVGRLDSSATALGQQPYWSPSVFNFYSPDHTPPSSALAERGLVAPEMQIANAASTIGWVNWFARFIKNPGFDLSLDLGDLAALAHDPAALVDEVGKMLCPDGLSDATYARILWAVAQVTNRTDQVQRRDRVLGAVVLVAASTDFLIER